MITDSFCFYLQNRLIQTSQTGGQWYSDTPPSVFPGGSLKHTLALAVRYDFTICIDHHLAH